MAEHSEKGGAFKKKSARKVGGCFVGGWKCGKSGRSGRQRKIPTKETGKTEGGATKGADLGKHLSSQNPEEEMRGGEVFPEKCAGTIFSRLCGNM